jgi:hypothetical protein
MSKENSNGDSRIVGQAACPYCQLTEGNPNAESRANQGADGRVSCVLCGRVSHPIPPSAADIYRQPEVIRKAVLQLFSATTVDAVTFKLAAVSTGDGYGAYHLGGDIDSILTTVSLVRGKFNDERIELSYTDFTLRYANNPSQAIGRDYDRKSLSCRVPYGIEQAAQRLLAEGFRFTGATVGETMRTLSFMKGSAIPGTTSIVGVTASISWIAD